MAALDRPATVFQLVHGVAVAVESAVDEEWVALSIRVSEAMAADDAPLAPMVAELEAAVRAFMERSRGTRTAS